MMNYVSRNDTETAHKTRIHIRIDHIGTVQHTNEENGDGINRMIPQITKMRLMASIRLYEINHLQHLQGI